MPCQSYETSWANGSSDRKIKDLKREADKLARIACAALNELEENGIAEVLLLKNDELREWWAAHKEADRKERDRLAEIERKERVKAEALASLSDEAKELLGLSKPKKPTSKFNTTLSTRVIDLGDPFGDEVDVEQWLKENGDDYGE
jgi:hypothetical protein